MQQIIIEVRCQGAVCAYSQLSAVEAVADKSLNASVTRTVLVPISSKTAGAVDRVEILFGGRAVNCSVCILLERIPVIVDIKVAVVVIAEEHRVSPRYVAVCLRLYQIIEVAELLTIRIRFSVACRIIVQTVTPTLTALVIRQIVKVHCVNADYISRKAVRNSEICLIIRGKSFCFNPSSLFYTVIQICVVARHGEVVCTGV